MKDLILDTETTVFQKGNPFSARNRLCSVGIDDDSGYSDYDIEYSASPYGSNLRRIETAVGQADRVVAFNAKFDIHWLKRYINDLCVKRVWDCQLAEFILDGQVNPFPSLDDTLGKYGLPLKLDVVKLEYWDRGLDTTDVPWDVLAEYQKMDVVSTKLVKEIQAKQFNEVDPRLFASFSWACADLLVLQEAEFNGLVIDVEEARRKAVECEGEINELEARLSELLGDSRLNWGSSDHISAVLYGGKISFKTRVRTERTLKSGEIKVGEKWGTEDVEFPRLVEPPERSENVATAGVSEEQLKQLNAAKLANGHRPVQRTYSTDESTLKSLRGGKRIKGIVELLLRYAELKKLVSTYYRGLPEIIEEMDWPKGVLHGQFNQCVAQTSRLSSSRPNLQNLAGQTKPLFISRYA